MDKKIDFNLKTIYILLYKKKQNTVSLQKKERRKEKMASKNTSSQCSIGSEIYNSRKNVLAMLATQQYNIQNHDQVSEFEVNRMQLDNQLDMLLQHKTKPRKVYIRYQWQKTLNKKNIEDIIQDLFILEEILTKNDTLLIVSKDPMNDPLQAELRLLYSRDNYFVIVQSLKALQFNVLNHDLVPPHRIMDDEEVEELMKKFNIKDKSYLPKLSRFDPAAQAIGIRPGEVCEIIRDSTTAIEAPYCRVCVE